MSNPLTWTITVPAYIMVLILVAAWTVIIACAVSMIRDYIEEKRRG